MLNSADPLRNMMTDSK